MRTVLVFLILLLALALGLHALGSAEGGLHAEWGAWQLDTSSAGMAMLVLALVLAGWFVIQASRLLVTFPSRTRRLAARQRHDRGLAALNRAFLALAQGDLTLAGDQQRIAERNLPKLALPLLLGAQIATQQKDPVRQQHMLERMLDQPDTRALAARSLLAEALTKGDMTAAQRYAQQALLAAPKDAAVQAMQLQLLVRQQAYTQAHDELHRWRATRRIRKAEAKRFEALLISAEAERLFHLRDYPAAARMLEQAVKLRPDWLPATLLLAQTWHAQQNAAALRPLVEKKWRSIPHPELARLHKLACGLLAPQNYLKLVQGITRGADGRVESLLWLADSAEQAAEWALAKEYAERAVLTQPSREGYQRLAQVQQRLTPHQPAQAMEFRARADIAPTLSWQCTACATPTPAWHPDCPHCHTLDGLAWNPAQDVDVMAA